MHKWNAWLPGGILALGCLVNGVLVGRKVSAMPLRAPIATVAHTALGIAGIDAPPFSKETERVAGMSSYINRVYDDTLDARPPFSIYVGYYEMQQQGKTIHSPKNCLPGAGWEMVEVEPRTFQTPNGPVTVSRNRLARPGGSAVVYYWYQGRGRVAYNELKVKYELLRDAALTGRTEEALVRIFIEVNSDKDVAAADKIAENEVASLVIDVDRVLPKFP